MKVLVSALIFVMMGVGLVSGMDVGKIKATRVVGEVLLEEKGRAKRQMVNGNRFEQDSSVYTGADGTTTLIFTNGSSVRLYEDTDFDVRKYVQELYNPNAGTYEELLEDPSESKTELFLGKGKLLFEVKSLQSFSDYEIHTPGGVAGVRGTRGVVSYMEREDGRSWQMCVIVEEGEVEVSSRLDENGFIRKALLECEDSLCFGGPIAPDGSLEAISWAMYTVAPPLPPAEVPPVPVIPPLHEKHRLDSDLLVIPVPPPVAGGGPVFV